MKGGRVVLAVDNLYSFDDVRNSVPLKETESTS